MEYEMPTEATWEWECACEPHPHWAGDQGLVPASELLGPHRPDAGSWGSLNQLILVLVSCIQECRITSPNPMPSPGFPMAVMVTTVQSQKHGDQLGTRHALKPQQCLLIVHPNNNNIHVVLLLCRKHSEYFVYINSSAPLSWDWLVLARDLTQKSHVSLKRPGHLFLCQC